MPYWRLNSHAVWVCKERQGLITPELELELYQYLLGKGLELGRIMQAVSEFADHFHTMFSLDPKYVLAVFHWKIKRGQLALGDACVRTSNTV